MKNILLVVPHPDDEIVGLFTIIKRILRKEKIFIFFLTNGVIDKKSLWFWERKTHEEKIKIRISEMKKSLNTLGIKKYFLQNISTRMLKENIEITFEKISEIKKKYKIDTIFCPAYEGGHQDHDVANFICSRFKNKCKVYEFAEYNFFDNRIRSNNFFIPSKKDNIIFLTNTEKKEKKRTLEIYKSESSNLNYISFEKESYRELYEYDYKLPPHRGTLFYRRFSFFSWHPKVDSDKPKQICKILINSKIF
ncbi:MAG: PIG-L family deacetylase [Pseudomonadota bacterium]|nr:PIG-L family deacetylase [Pseudomonadota bacterium]